ncbi:NUDIX hydrolase [Paenibacillus athensensis]|uniref:NUDIX hydrolase n=2 Tax=Paenibacillus athensensis TaxID=1967502 RepID=A0A4Y8PV90_9BACL|nr:NUDIX hydrolase [Paenibacillus athensensis]
MLSVALLWNSRDELLMMKRSLLRTLSPGLWGAVGGHMEPEELNDPRSACVREIFEETGLTEGDIAGLELRYVLLRLNGAEIRQQFFYVGHTDCDPRIATCEGDLHWVPRAEVLNRPLPFIFRMLLEHHLCHGTAPGGHPWVGTAGLNGPADTPGVLWTPLVDPGQI